MDSPNMAVMQYQLQAQQATIDRLVPLVEGLVVTTSNLVQSQKMFNIRQEEHEKMVAEKIQPKLDELWDTKNENKGGWVLLGWVGGFVLGAAAIGGFILALMEHFDK